jgi:tetratricopeptide (TPR) repeat protein
MKASVYILLLLTALPHLPGLDVSQYYEEYSDIVTTGEWERAEELFTRAVAEHPGEITFHIILNETKRKLGKKEEALAQILPVFEANPDAAAPAAAYQVSLVELGLHERDEGRPDEALDLLRRAYELDPGDITATLWYGILLRETGRIEESVELLESGEKRFDNHYITAHLIYSYVELAKLIGVDDPGRAEALY